MPLNWFDEKPWYAEYKNTRPALFTLSEKNVVLIKFRKTLHNHCLKKIDITGVLCVS